MKHTDLNKLKEIALDFLDIEPEAVPEFPLIVNHPYYDSRIMALPKPTEDGQFNVEPFDIFECPEKFEKLKDHMRESIINGNLDTIFARILAKYHLAFLKFAKPYMSKKDFDTYLGYSWVFSENPNQDANVDIPTLIKWFKSANPKHLMDKEEYEYYCELPNVIEVYRGVAVGRAKEDGLSWTCNRKTAEWFANRFNYSDNKGYIIKGVIDKADVFAYFNGRNEDEICCNSSKVRDIQKTTFSN